MRPKSTPRPPRPGVLVGTIGPALVYEREEPGSGMLFYSRVYSYYWRYYDKPTVYGPFTTKEDLERHINGCLVASGRLRDEIPDNTVKVDFRAKKRVV